MRRNFVYLTSLIVLLAACGGSPTPTPTVETVIEPTAETSTGPATATVMDSSAINNAPTFTPVSNSVTLNAPSVTPIGNSTDAPIIATVQGGSSQGVTGQDRVYETGQPTLLPPGTLVAASTPDPDAGLVFDTILYEQSGGISGQTLTIEVQSDGTIIRNGVSSRLSPDQIIFIDDILDQLNYFGIQGIFVQPGAGADLQRYRITVDRAGSSVSIDAQDGLIPPELAQLFSIISSLGAT